MRVLKARGSTTGRIFKARCSAGRILRKRGSKTRILRVQCSRRRIFNVGELMVCCKGARLDRAHLEGAHLYRARLQGAMSLTQQQIDSALRRRNTAPPKASPAGPLDHERGGAGRRRVSWPSFASAAKRSRKACGLWIASPSARNDDPSYRPVARRPHPPGPLDEERGGEGADGAKPSLPGAERSDPENACGLWICFAFGSQ